MSMVIDLMVDTLCLVRSNPFNWYFRNISLLEALPIFGLMVKNYMYSIPMEVVKIWMYRVVEYSSVELNMILGITMVVIILEM